jgi:hypothetical protein
MQQAKTTEGARQRVRGKKRLKMRSGAGITRRYNLYCARSHGGGGTPTVLLQIYTASISVYVCVLVYACTYCTFIQLGG